MSRPLLLLSVLLAAWPGRTLRSQEPRPDQRAMVAVVEQAMIAVLESRNFVRARHLCDQLILWEPANPVHHYNLACIEACAGGARLPLAFAALEQAVKLGFNDASHMKADPDFKSIRDDPRFAELVQRCAANASAAAAADSLAIPDRPPLPALAAPATRAASSTPQGLYLATRQSPPATEPAFSAWYFAADGRVFQDLRQGVESADLSGHRGPRGLTRLAGGTFEITWSDSTKTTSALTLRDGGWEWAEYRFAPVAAFPSSAPLIGTFAAPANLSARGDLAELPRRLDLRTDGSARWTTADNREVEGRWELRGFALRLVEPDGTVVQWLALPLASPSQAAPDRILLGGIVFRRT